MGRIRYSMMVSLDGYIEDRDGGIGFSAPAEDLHRHSNEAMRDCDLELYGRRLLEMMEPFWPDTAANPSGVDHFDEFARLYVETPRIVFSTTLGEVRTGNELRRSIDEDEIRRLRDEHENIGVGGATLASELAGLGLIDEVEMLVQPVVIGGGKPMFGPGFEGLTMEPIDALVFESGARALSYRIADR